MIKTFVDTAAWIGLVDEDDDLHEKARTISKDLTQRAIVRVTTEFVLLEVADAFCSPPMRAVAVQFINDLRRARNLEILPASTELFAAGWRLYSQRPDKAWSLTDCISFTVMQEQGIREAFTSDRHFEQAGFEKLI